MTNTEIYDKIEKMKIELQHLMEQGIVTNPALFWSGQMSTYISILKNQSLISSHDYLNLLFAVQEEYDNVIWERNK
jgi:endo-1,4-beta-mannosidase